MVARRKVWTACSSNGGPDLKPDSARVPTEGMVDYDRNSAMQRHFVRSHASRLGGLVEQIGVVEPEFRLVDYGCGPGHSAIDAVRPAIKAYRALSPNGPITICHADQVGNDWNALFALAAGAEGYRTTGVRTEASVGSFYQTLAPPGSVSLGTCFVASHWLSRAVPLDAPGTMWFADLQGQARAEMAERARADWTTFLRCRAQELRSGAYLLVSTLGAVPDPSELQGVAASARGLYRAAQTVAQGMADEGLLDQRVLDGFVFPVWFATAEETRAPIDCERDLAACFEIDELCVDPAKFNPDDVYADELANPPVYGELYAGYLRGFADSTLRRQLFGPSAGSDPEVDTLAATFYRRIADLYRDAPGKHASETWEVTIVLRRR